MAKLTSAGRKKLPNSAFGLPKQRKYPEENASHAKDAKSRAAEMHNRGAISDAEFAKIDAKADRVLGHGKKGKDKK